MGVSKNRGKTPKWMVYNVLMGWFGGVSFLETSISGHKKNEKKKTKKRFGQKIHKFPWVMQKMLLRFFGGVQTQNNLITNSTPGPRMTPRKANPQGSAVTFLLCRRCVAAPLSLGPRMVSILGCSWCLKMSVEDGQYVYYIYFICTHDICISKGIACV